MRVLPVALLVLGTLACGRSSSQAQDTASEPPSLAASLEIDTTKLQKTESGLGILDVKVGDGALAEAGKNVTAHYTLYKPDGEKMESSHDAGEPITFRLGRGEVIAGWDEGIAGMKVGGRRKLVVPSDLAYNNGTLVFDVELLSVE